MSLVELRQDPHGIATITLNDPDRRNAMGLDMAAEFRRMLTQIATDPGTRTLVLTGTAPAFSAGGDLEMLTDKADRSRQRNRAEMMDYYESFLGIVKLPIPTVCAINGHAMGAGLGLALACDVRLVAASARLGLNFSRLGLHPGMGTTYFLPRLVGYAVAMDLLTTGRAIGADEAYRLGLVAGVHSTADDVLEAAHALASSYLQCGPAALAAVLATLRPDGAALDRALQREADEQSKNYASAEFAEGLAAALEKRSPLF